MVVVKEVVGKPLGRGQQTQIPYFFVIPPPLFLVLSPPPSSAVVQLRQLLRKKTCSEVCIEVDVNEAGGFPTTPFFREAASNSCYLPITPYIITRFRETVFFSILSFHSSVKRFFSPTSKIPRNSTEITHPIQTPTAEWPRKTVFVDWLNFDFVDQSNS